MTSRFPQSRVRARKTTTTFWSAKAKKLLDGLERAPSYQAPVQTGIMAFYKNKARKEKRQNRFMCGVAAQNLIGGKPSGSFSSIRNERRKVSVTMNYDERKQVNRGSIINNRQNKLPWKMWKQKDKKKPEDFLKRTSHPSWFSGRQQRRCL